jgi:glutathione peroxidase
MKPILILTLLFGILTVSLSAQTTKENTMSQFYSYSMKTIDGKQKSLADYRGKVVMVVNTASFCGNTPQYKQLEELYKKYKDKGLVIAGFPANNFGKQEPGSDSDIKTFCERNYGVTFDMFSKISVKGDDIHPLYKYLTTETEFKGEVDWNFAKFIVDKNGKVCARFKARMKPDEKEIVQKLDELLAQK